MIKHNLLELLEDGETVVPLAGTRTPTRQHANTLNLALALALPP